MLPGSLYQRLAIALVVAIFSSASSQAHTFTWTGLAPAPNNTDWSNSLNWKDESQNPGVPGSGDTANIGTVDSNGAALTGGYTVNLTSAATVASLSVVTSTITGSDLTVTGPAAFYVADLKGPGILTLQGETTFTFPTGYASHATTIEGRYITNTGTITLQASTQIIFSTSKSVLTNNGTIDVEDNSQLTLGSGGTGSEIHNVSTFEKVTGAGTTNVNGLLFTNVTSGQVTCNAGMLHFLTAAVDQSGAFFADDIGQIEVESGELDIHNGANFTGLGLHSWINVPIYVDGTATVPGHVQFGSPLSQGKTLNLNAKTGNTAGTLEISGVFDWAEGSISSTSTTRGTLQIDSAAQLNIPNPDAMGLAGAHILNKIGGKIVWTGTDVGLSNNARIDNAGLFDIQTDSSLKIGGNGGPTDGLVSNTGTLQKSVSPNPNQASFISLNFDNSGTLQCSAGTLRLYTGSDGSLIGTIGASAGAVLEINGGTHVIIGTLHVASAGRTVLDGSGTIGFGGAPQDIIKVDSGTFEIAGGSVSGVLGLGEMFVATGATLLWSGGGNFSGDIIDQSNLVVDPGGMLVISGGGTRTIAGWLIFNGGSVTVSSGTGQVTFGTNAGVLNLSGASFIFQADCTFADGSGGVAPLPVFSNAGTLSKTASNFTTTIGFALDNEGTISISSGTLQVFGYTDSSGTNPFGVVNLNNAAAILFTLATTTNGTIGGNGRVTADGGLTTRGTLKSHAGPLDIYGDLNGLGDVDLGDVPGAAPSPFSAGSKVSNVPEQLQSGTPSIVTVHGKYTHGASATLRVPIQGTNAATPDFGQLKDTNNGSNTGGITLIGTLTANVLHGYVPASTDTFAIISTNQGISGTFKHVANGARTIDQDGSGSFVVTYSASSVVLSSYNLPPANFSQWQNAHFTPAQLADPNISGPLADPDHDGLNNLLEYALNADPNDPSSNHRPFETLDATNLSLTYTKVLGATDLTYAIEQSLDLVAWSPVTPTNQILFDNGFVQTIQAEVPRSNAEPGGKLFLRLSVTQQ